MFANGWGGDGGARTAACLLFLEPRGRTVPAVQDAGRSVCSLGRKTACSIHPPISPRNVHNVLLPPVLEMSWRQLPCPAVQASHFLLALGSCSPFPTWALMAKALGTCLCSACRLLEPNTFKQPKLCNAPACVLGSGCCCLFLLSASSLRVCCHEGFH